MNTNSILLMLGRWSFVLVVISLFSIPASATDFTLFGGMQHAGDLTVESAQSGSTSLVQNFDPKTFGVFGVRFGHGKVIGGEYTAEYAPNFISSDRHAWLFHSNVRVQIPIPALKPYATG